VKALFLFLFPIALGAQTSGADARPADTAGDMLSNCRPIERATTRGQMISFAPTYEAGLCWGAFAAVQRATAFASDRKPLLSVCAPENSTRAQFVAVFVHFVDRRPERRHEDWFIVAWDALRAAFPCSPA
jgi:hypothetical protein